MNTYTIDGTYGSGRTPCEVFVYEKHGLNWYAVEGSLNVNATFDDIREGADVESLSDVDAFTASMAIESLDDLEREVDE